jgi:hypothetical protein
MRILEVVTNAWHEVTIEEISPKEIRTLSRKRYFFDWNEARRQAPVYKLCIVGNNDIKGLMALVDHPKECRIEIKLLSASRENAISIKEKGKKQKEFDEIPGNLIAFAGIKAFEKYGDQACISLVPKTEIREHYIRKYGMINAGRQLYLESDLLWNLINKYTL